MAPVVEVAGVTKNFKQIQALRGVSWTIERGSVVAFLGPNGAGKTTSISIMLGLRKPSSGTARLFGLDPSDLRARSRVGVMLQESGVAATLKVKELVKLFCSYYPDPLRPERAIQMAGLEDKANTQVTKLSGGQKQRLYYALAVCGNPEVLFLDEPTVGLDVESRRQFWSSVRSMAQEGRTIILTTHYLEEADQLAQRIVVVNRGSVVADAPPAEIKAMVSGRRIRFRSPNLTEAAFQGLPVERVQLEEDRVSLISSRPEEVLRKLFARNLDITDLEVGGVDLEEAFLSLTAQETEETEQSAGPVNPRSGQEPVRA